MLEFSAKTNKRTIGLNNYLPAIDIIVLNNPCFFMFANAIISLVSINSSLTYTNQNSNGIRI